MKRTIKVTGKGNLTVKPDTIRLIIYIDDTEYEHEAAVKASAEATQEMRELFMKLGFDKNSLKTLEFDIDAKYESYKSSGDTWKKRFVGYEWFQKLKIEFPLDSGLLGKVLYSLGNSDLDPEFRIKYTVSDTEGQKNKLLEAAVADAKEKAAVLAAAAEVKLEKILNIDYSMIEIDFISHSFEDMQMLKACDAGVQAGGYDVDINPDDIKVSDTVTIIWEIE